MNGYLFWILCYVQFGAFFYGFDSGLTTGIIAYPSFIEYFGFDNNTLGALGSVYYGGNFFGCVLNIVTANRLGRKRTIALACVIGIIAGVIQCAAQNLGMLLAGRVIGGVASGLIFAACPMLGSELSPPDWRGRVGAIYAVYVGFSYMLTEWLGLAFYYIQKQDVNWRLFLGLQLVMPIVMLAGLLVIPESPRWLIYAHKDEKAKAVLKTLHASYGNDEHFYLKEFNQIRLQLELEAKKKLGLMAILRKPSYRKRFLIIGSLTLGQNLTGIIPLQNYQVILYARVGVDTTPKLLLLTGVWGTLAVLMSAIGGFFYDKIGRRKSLFISIGIMLFASILAVIFWAQFEAQNNREILGRLTIAFFFLFLCGFGYAINCTVYTYPPEIAPMEVRAVAVSWAFIVFNLITIMLVQVTPLAIAAISWRYFIIFIVCDFLFGLCVYFYYPETKGRTLEEIAGLFGDEVAVDWDHADYAGADDKGSDLEKKGVVSETQHVERPQAVVA